MCVFCSIARESAGADVVFRDDATVAFLDHRPLFPGHCLLIPINHYETLTDLPDALLEQVFVNARTLTRAVEDAVAAEGSFVAMNNRVSQSVPHFHLHVVPRRRKDGLRGFFWPRGAYRDDHHRSAITDAIRASLERLPAK